MLDKCQLLIGGIGRDRKVGTGWPPATLLGAEWRICQHKIGLGQPLAIRTERVSQGDARCFNAMQHQVH
jgi:hypothetical protein